MELQLRCSSQAQLKQCLWQSPQPLRPPRQKRCRASPQVLNDSVPARHPYFRAEFARNLTGQRRKQEGAWNTRASRSRPPNADLVPLAQTQFHRSPQPRRVTRNSAVRVLFRFKHVCRLWRPLAKRKVLTVILRVIFRTGCSHVTAPLEIVLRLTPLTILMASVCVLHRNQFRVYRAVEPPTQRCRSSRLSVTPRTLQQVRSLSVEIPSFFANFQSSTRTASLVNYSIPISLNLEIDCVVPFELATLSGPTTSFLAHPIHRDAVRSGQAGAGRTRRRSRGNLSLGSRQRRINRSSSPLDFVFVLPVWCVWRVPPRFGKSATLCVFCFASLPPCRSKWPIWAMRVGHSSISLRMWPRGRFVRVCAVASFLTRGGSL